MGLAILVISILAIAGTVYAYSQGVPEHSETGCNGGCHGQAPDQQTNVTIEGLPDQYVLEETYLLTIYVNSTSISGETGGFDLSVTAGALSTNDPNAKIEDGEATHQNNNARSWQVIWAAPTEYGSANFYIVGLASDGTGPNGDGYALGSYSIDSEPSPSENLPPAADFSYAISRMTIEFQDLSQDEDGNITDWLWNFGEDKNSTEKSPTHTFLNPGKYSVTLTVTDDQGDRNTKSATFLIPVKEELLQLWTQQVLIGSILLLFTALLTVGIAARKRRGGPPSKGEEK
jgi:PKD repeat protein